MNQIVEEICSCERNNVAEIGVLSGKISGRLLSYNNCIKKLYMIDPWMEYININQSDSKDKRLLEYNQDKWDAIYKNACNTANKFKDRAEIIRKTSIDASLLFLDNFFDIVIIDADHTYKSVVLDIINWLPKIKDNGTLYGHDYCSGWKDVVDAVNNIFDKDFVRLENCYWKVNVLNSDLKYGYINKAINLLI